MASPSSSRPTPPTWSTNTVSWAPCTSTSTRSSPRASRRGDSAPARSSILRSSPSPPLRLPLASGPAKRKRGPQPTLQRGTDLQMDSLRIIAIAGVNRSRATTAIRSLSASPGPASDPSGRWRQRTVTACWARRSSPSGPRAPGDAGEAHARPPRQPPPSVVTSTVRASRACRRLGQELGARVCREHVRHPAAARPPGPRSPSRGGAG